MIWKRTRWWARYLFSAAWMLLLGITQGPFMFVRWTWYWSHYTERTRLWWGLSVAELRPIEPSLEDDFVSVLAGKEGGEANEVR